MPSPGTPISKKIDMRGEICQVMFTYRYKVYRNILSIQHRAIVPSGRELNKRVRVRF